jgi:integrase/recombinase XerD
MSISRQIDAYLRHLTVERGMSKNTLAAYRRDLNRYEQFLTERGIYSVETISELIVGDFGIALTAKWGLAATSVARVLSGVRGFHRYLMIEGVTANDNACLLYTSDAADE